MNHVPPPKSPCAHKTYRLTCDQYDRLVNAAGGTCQICSTAPTQAPQGFLVVDHDAMIGRWAVRGLLCTACNTALPAGAEPEWARAYLATPWWQGELSPDGNIAALDEPPVGAVIVVPRNIHWRRTAAGWEHVANYGGPARSWAWINHKYGGHNIRMRSDS
jgi:hypothetical protein